MLNLRSAPISLPMIPTPPIAIHVQRDEEVHISDVMGVPETGIIVHNFNTHIEELMEQLDPLPPFPIPSLLSSSNIALLPSGNTRFIMLPNSLAVEQLLKLKNTSIKLDAWILLHPQHLALINEVVGFRGRYVQLRLEVFPNGKPQRFPLSWDMWVDSKDIKLGWKDRV
ncbi:hypothetical protein BDN71DRAFT_1430256 [Pleurotus eryngii]|uniref:Uncharacterized protein n=1 Tax=Pleurotus eryngii TaxID=5323 RepID=A0A9P6A0M3_PLEER|nr:hypothetical protein BDN71DRAFT_1430256 [Pleurotus eryngii]